MRLVYVIPPADPRLGGIAFTLIAGYFAYGWIAGLYTWVANLFAGGVWLPLNPFIYIGTFLVALPLTLLLAAWAADGHGVRRWVLGTAAVAVAAAWLLFALDRSLGWQDRRDASASYAAWEELHREQPSGDGADIRIDSSVLDATRRVGLGPPEPPAGIPLKDRNAALRVWQRKAAASAHLWRDKFVDNHLRSTWQAPTTRVVPYLWFGSLISLPTFRYSSALGMPGSACETHTCVAVTDIRCSALFSDPEANVGLRPAPTLFVNRGRVLERGPGALASSPQPNGTLTPEGLALLRSPPRWLNRYPKVMQYCRDRLNVAL